jgi:hypothetical protein
MLGETLVPASTEISHAENHRMRTPKAQQSHVEYIPVEGVSSSERVDPSPWSGSWSKAAASGPPKAGI